jgi:hypothetical protein
MPNIKQVLNNNENFIKKFCAEDPDRFPGYSTFLPSQALSCAGVAGIISASFGSTPEIQSVLKKNRL